jgi:lipopolysaccharide biosynthesis glycosyltransferase
MKLVTSLNVPEEDSHLITFLQVAIYTARKVGYDDIVLLYTGKKPHVKDCKLIKVKSQFEDQINNEFADQNHRNFYLGTMLRLEIPYTLDDEYVLYTDVDVIHHLKMTDEEMPRPEFISLCFEYDPEDPMFNGGVGVLHLPKLRDEKFIQYCKDHLKVAWDDALDQGLVNNYYKDKIELLSPKWNYRPYWKQPRFEGIFPELKIDPCITHFHGPKPYLEQYWPSGHNYSKFLLPDNYYVAADQWMSIVEEMVNSDPSFYINGK